MFTFRFGLVPAVFAVVLWSNLAAAQTAVDRGCFTDQGEPNRDLNGHSVQLPDMTVEFCINECHQRGFDYAGLQYGTWCFCGDGYGDYGPATNCDMPCAGGDGKMCGGYWANSVWSVRVIEATPTSPSTPVEVDRDDIESDHEGPPDDRSPANER